MCTLKYTNFTTKIRNTRHVYKIFRQSSLSNVKELPCTYGIINKKNNKEERKKVSAMINDSLMCSSSTTTVGCILLYVTTQKKMIFCVMFLWGIREL